jgi:hypothetical protein
MKKPYYISLAASGVYSGLCVAAFAYHFARTAHDKFSAIFLVILTAPWTGLYAILKDSVIATVFHYEIGFVGNTIAMIVSALINTGLIFYFSTKLNR